MTNDLFCKSLVRPAKKLFQENIVSFIFGTMIQTGTRIKIVTRSICNVNSVLNSWAISTNVSTINDKDTVLSE